MEGYKTCSKCGESKPVENFAKGRAQCRPCRREAQNVYQRRTARKRFERMQGRPPGKKGPPTKVYLCPVCGETKTRKEMTQTKTRCLGCKDKSRLSEEEKKERAKMGVRVWYQANKEKVSQRFKEWHSKPENKAKVAANVHKRRVREEAAGGNFTAEEFMALCSHYGNKCLCCGKKRKLTADHVKPVSRGGRNDITNIQPLCKSCNCKKHAHEVDYRPDRGGFSWTLL